MYNVKYNDMSHQPQEGSNRSLAYCTLLDVFWQMCNEWITYGCSEGLSYCHMKQMMDNQEYPILHVYKSTMTVLPYWDHLY